MFNSLGIGLPIINDHRRAICQRPGFAFGFIAGTALWIGLAQGRLEHRPVELHFFALPQVLNRVFLGTCSSGRILTQPPTSKSSGGASVSDPAFLIRAY